MQLRFALCTGSVLAHVDLAHLAGPVLWGPLSELYGRKISILVPYFIFICLTAIASTTDRFSSLVILRFFAGLCASACVAVMPPADSRRRLSRQLAAVLRTSLRRRNGVPPSWPTRSP